MSLNFSSGDSPGAPFVEPSAILLAGNFGPNCLYLRFQISGNDNKVILHTPCIVLHHEDDGKLCNNYVEMSRVTSYTQLSTETILQQLIASAREARWTVTECKQHIFHEHMNMITILSTKLRL